MNDDSMKPINLDCFIKQKKIGSGSYSKVYTIGDKRTGKILAAKVLNQQLNEDLDISDIQREINIISKLTHPVVLKFYRYCSTDFKQNHKLVIITDFASNGTLKNLLQKERENGSNQILNPTLKLIIIYGIAAAMLYLHSNNIIHRDLKPENILLDEFLHPKIADFGLSKIQRQSATNSTKELKGTPFYMAPEIFHKCEYTEASDVYAFALIVYEIITNEQPYSNVSSYFQLLSNINKGYRPPFNKEIPQSYKFLIENCWSEDPTKRPSFIQIILLLKLDSGLITEEVNMQDYIDYIEYLDGCERSFDRITKIKLNESFDKLPRYIRYLDYFKDNDNASCIFPYNVFTNLDKECKDLVEEAQNDPNKLFLIGQYLIEGQEKFPRIVHLGIKHLKMSMKKRLKESAAYYCRMLIKGSIIPMNLNKAKKILEKYFDHQEATYLNLYAKIYLKEQNYEDSKRFYEKAIQLGNMILKGKGFPIVQEKAIEYYKSVIEKGCIKASFKYGMLLKNSENEEIRNEGIKYIKFAADNCHIKAMYEYSLIIKDDQEDNEEYLEFLKNAANKCHTEAMYEYSLILSTHEYKDQDIKNCIRLLKMACDKGHIK